MTTTEAQGMCHEVDENMSDIIDGVADNALFNHMAGCERCRDARYDAEQVISRLSDAAADYRLPSDLEARLMQALDHPPAPVANGASPSERVKEKARSLIGALRRDSRAPAAEATEQAPPRSRAMPQTDGTIQSSRWAWLSLLVAVVLGVVWFGSRPDPEQPRAPEHARPAGAWQGQVVRVERAFGSPSGLTECARGTQACQPLGPGDVAHPGMRLETDGLTRALVKFADGSLIALDRQSRLELDPNERRRGRLLEGNIVAEIERLTDIRGAANGAGDAASHAIIDVPFGRAEVLGTKFSLRAADDSTRVEVSRGSVRLFDAHEEPTDVQAGESAVIGSGRAARVENVPDLGQAFEWSNFEEGPETAARGALGELTAKRPRDGQDVPGAVRLAEHHIKVRIVDNIARTEVEEVFENGSDEVLEGIYRFPLPPDAQIERLALEVDGKLVDGAFVDREKAAAIWRGAVVNAGGKKPAPNEDIIWVPGPWRDPALLEWQRGSRFELRIFPIAKRSSRRVVLAYTEVLAPSEGERTYTYPLPRDPRGSTRISRFTAEVQVRGHAAARGVQARGYPMHVSSSAPEVAMLAFDENDFAPRGDLTVAFELMNADAELRSWAYQPGRPDTEKSEKAEKSDKAEKLEGTLPERPVGTVPGPFPDGDSASRFVEAEPGVPADAPYVAFALRPNLPRRAHDEPRDYVLVADTSRSMIGESYRRAILAVTRIIQEMDRSDRVTVLGCDSSCQPLPGGFLRPGEAAAEAAGRFLESIEPEGASDLGFAIERAASLRERDAEPATRVGAARSLRVIYVGDGTPTVGPIHPALLERAVSLALPIGASLSAVAIGSDADRGALRVATRAGGGVTIAFTPGRSAEDVAYAVLGATYGHSLSNARLELPEGLSRVMPRKLGSLAAGAEALIVARMTRPSIEGTVVLRGEVAGEEFEERYPLSIVAHPGRANAFVPRLYAAVAIAELESSMDESARRRSIELSTRFNVASRYTSLLVLESPAMFSAFGLDNRRSAPEWTGELESQKAESAREEELLYSVDPGASEPRNKAKRESLGSGGRARGSSGAAPRSLAPAPSAAENASDTDESASAAYAGPDKATPAPSWAERSGTEGALPEPEQPEPLEMAPPSRRLLPMRRVTDRVGLIDVPPGLLPLAAPARRADLERRVRENAESRDALRAAFVADFLAGDLEAAARAAEHWSEKDPLDVDALTARADLAAQRGDRERAIRILGSVVDVRPGDYKAQWRLARLHRWAGRPERGCRHSLAVAQLMLSDAKLVSEAVGCSRDVGQHRTADELLAALEPGVRREVERRVPERKSSDGLSGDFRVEATWQGSSDDVDVVILDPDGYRVSWLGAPTRAVITANDVLSVHREAIALRGASPGRYAIELVRSAGARGAPVRGSVRVQVGNADRNLPFVLEGVQARVATATLRNETRLVPIDAWE